MNEPSAVKAYLSLLILLWCVVAVLFTYRVRIFRWLSRIWGWLAYWLWWRWNPVDITDKIHMLDPNDAPLTKLMMKLREEGQPDIDHDWIDDEYLPAREGDKVCIGEIEGFEIWRRDQ